MSAIFYYIDSINTLSPTFAYPCSNYKNFVRGLCTSNGNQQTGYHASSNRTLGSLYFMTLHGIESSPHFGTRKHKRKRLKENSYLSRLSF